jgi:hypothetical protein
LSENHHLRLLRRQSHPRERDEQAASIHDLKLPMLLPGITVSTSADDLAPIKQMQLMKFDGSTWKLFGEVISASRS